VYKEKFFGDIDLKHPNLALTMNLLKYFNILIKELKLFIFEQKGNGFLVIGYFIIEAFQKRKLRS